MIGLAFELPPLPLGFVEQAAPAVACAREKANKYAKIRIDTVLAERQYRAALSCLDVSPERAPPGVANVVENSLAI